MTPDFYEIKTKAKVWIFEGPAAWYMVTIPAKESSEIHKIYGDFHRGWGSIPVKVTIGSSTWKTSIFWEKKGTYILPIKKEVRKKEQITNGDMVEIALAFEHVI
jgi:hypothetical protein